MRLGADREEREERMRKTVLVLLVGILGAVLLISPVLQGASADIETQLNQLEERIQTLEKTVDVILEMLSKEFEDVELSETEEFVQQKQRDIEAEIKAYAKKKWPDDYEMQVYEFNNQMEAYEQIRNLFSAPDYNESILFKALAKWGQDYEMVIYEYDNQLEAYKKMR